MSSRNGSDEVARDLAVIDAALAGETLEGELAELALLLRAERPKPRLGYVSELDARVEQGFRTRLRGANRAAPVLAGALASVFIAGVAVLSSGVLSSDGGSDKPSAVPLVAPAERPEAASPLQAPAPATAGDAATRASERKVERGASLTLAPPADDVERVADEVIGVTDRYEGFVVRSTVSGGEAETAGGSLELRIPAGRLQPAIRDLSSLAHVRSRTQNAEDVTNAYSARRQRLQEALAERRSLLRRLARAATVNETASIRARLRLVKREIAAAQRSLDALRARVRYAAVTVAIEPDDNASSGSGSSTVGAALDDAGEILGTSLAVAVVVLAVLVPLSLIALVAWLVGRRLVRDRRERVLDDAI